jgi:hypothetical protein
VHLATLDILRCPYCGGRLELAEALYHQLDGDDVRDAVLGCHCCIFAVVAGIPVLHLQPRAVAAREHVEAGQPVLALRTMLELSDAMSSSDGEGAAAPGASILKALLPTPEAARLLSRLSDPAYRVAHALIDAVGNGPPRVTGRAIDLCGGAGHLMPALAALSTPAPVLAELSYVQAWLAGRLIASDCEAVCCDPDASLPFARGAFGLAACVDALHRVQMKRQLVEEMLRLIDRPGERGAVVIAHARTRPANGSMDGTPLDPAGYRSLFDTTEPLVFRESRLLADVAEGRPLDVSAGDSWTALEGEEAIAVLRYSP